MTFNNQQLNSINKSLIITKIISNNSNKKQHKM